MNRALENKDKRIEELKKANERLTANSKRYLWLKKKAQEPKTGWPDYKGHHHQIHFNSKYKDMNKAIDQALAAVEGKDGS